MSLGRPVSCSSAQSPSPGRGHTCRGGLRGRLAFVMAVMAAAFALLLALPTAAYASSGTSMVPFKSVGSGSWSASGRYIYDNCTVEATTTGSERHVKITLTQDVTLDDFWYVTGEYTKNYYVELDLNGHTLQRNLSSKVSDGCVICIDGSTNLHVMDSVGTGKITGGKSKNMGGGICVTGGTVYDGPMLTLTNVRVTGNESKSYGGGIFITTYGSLTIEGSSSVDSNTSGNDGGGIHLSTHSKFTMTGSSTVTGNDAGSNYGGGIYGGARTGYWLLGGNASVTNNKAKYGGGIYLHDSYVSSSNGTNYLRSDEAVYLRDNFTVKGNSATEDGGGIYLNNGSAVYMGGSVNITGNSAKRGGGMYMNTSWFHDAYLIFEDGATPKITGNTVSGTSTASNLQLDARSARLVGMDKLQDGTSIGLTVPDQSEGQSVVKDKTIYIYTDWNKYTEHPSGTVSSDRTEGSYFSDDTGTWEFHGISRGKNGSNWGSTFLCAIKKGGGTCPQITKVSVEGIASSDVKTEVNGDQVTVTVPYGTDLTKLTPSYSLAYATESIYSKWMTKTGRQVDCSQPLTVMVRDIKSGTSYSTLYTVTFKWGEPQSHSITVRQAAYEYTIEAPASAKQDETVTVKVTPEPGYKFVCWNVKQGDVTLDSPNTAETTFKMGSEDVVLEPVVSFIKYTVHYVDNYGYEYYKCDHYTTLGLKFWVDKSKIDQGYKLVEIKTPDGYQDLSYNKFNTDILLGEQLFSLGTVKGQYEGDIYFTIVLKERGYPVEVTGGTIASVNGEAAGAGTSSGSYANGTKLTLAVDQSAVPVGKRFKQWKITDSTMTYGQSPTVTYSGDASLDYTVAETYTIKAFDPAGKISIEAEYEDDISQKLTVEGGSGSGGYDTGTTASVAANVPAGYSFDHWEPEGITLTDAQAKAASFTLTMPGNDVTLKAVLAPIDYTLNVEGGSVVQVVRDGADVTETYGGKFHVGDILTLKPDALPTGAAAFGGWEETTSGSASVLTYTGTTNEFLFGVGNASVKATYTYALTTVNATSEQKLYKAGDTVTVTATPAEGESFSGNWTLNGIDESATKKDASAGTISFRMPEGAVVVTAEMDKTNYALTLDGASVAKVVRDGHDITATYGGKLHVGDLVSMKNEEDGQGKEFFYWTAADDADDADDADTRAAASMQWFTDTEGRDAFIMPTENVNLTAHYTYALTVEGGTCDWFTSSKENMVSCYEPDEEVTFKAKSSLKETFTGWTVVSGLDEGSDAYKAIMADKTGTVTVALPKPSSGSSVVVRANYEDNPVYSVNLNDGPWASYCEGEQVTISIDAETFKGWADDYKASLGLSDWEQKTENGRVIVTFTMPKPANGASITLDVETYALVNYVNLTMETPTSANIDTAALNLAASSCAEVNGSEAITNSATLVDVADAGNASAASLMSEGGEAEASLMADEATADGSLEKDLTLLLSISDAVDNPENLKFASDLVVTYNGKTVHATVADDALKATVDLTFVFNAQHTLAFETNGGGAIDAVTADEGTVVDLSQYVPTRDGYSFAGWCADEALAQKVETVTLDADVTVYAKWEKKGASGGSSDNGSGGNSGSSDNSGNGSKAGSTSAASGKGSKKSVPQTGDTTSYLPIIVAAVVGVVAVAAGIVIHRKRS